MGKGSIPLFSANIQTMREIFGRDTDEGANPLNGPAGSEVRILTHAPNNMRVWSIGRALAFQASRLSCRMRVRFSSPAPNNESDSGSGKNFTAAVCVTRGVGPRAR